MPYEAKTVRIELGDNHWAVFYEEINHGTQRAVNALTRPFLRYPKGKGPKLAKDTGGTIKIEVMGEARVDLKSIDFDAINDAILVGQIKEWSLAEEVSQAALDKLPDVIREKLKREADRLYGSKNPLPSGGAAS